VAVVIVTDDRVKEDMVGLALLPDLSLLHEAIVITIAQNNTCMVVSLCFMVINHKINPDCAIEKIIF
jgi:hypothetical protein